MVEGADAGDQQPSVEPRDAGTSGATAVLPPVETTAVLPEAAPTAAEAAKGAPVTARAARAPRNRGAWILASILVMVLLLALLLSAVLGGDLSSPSAVRVRVPKLGGLELEEARDRLRAAGLNLRAINRVEGPPGIVIRAEPPGGKFVAYGTPVTLFVGAPPEPTEDEEGNGKGKGKGNGKGGGNGGGGGDDD
jgi:hypothetical protein